MPLCGTRELRSCVPYVRPIRLKQGAFRLFPELDRLGLRFEVDYFRSKLWYIDPIREFPNQAPFSLKGGAVIHCEYRQGHSTVLRSCSRARGICRLLENVCPSPSFSESEIFSETTDLAKQFVFYELIYGEFREAAHQIGDLVPR